MARNAGSGPEIANEIRLRQNDSGGAINFRCRWITAGVGEIRDGETGVHNRIHGHHRSASASAMETSEAFRFFRHIRRELRKIKCAAMVVLFDGVGDVLECRRWM